MTVNIISAILTILFSLPLIFYRKNKIINVILLFTLLGFSLIQDFQSNNLSNDFWFSSSYSASMRNFILFFLLIDIISGLHKKYKLSKDNSLK